MTNYDYSPDVLTQLERALRDILPGGTMVKAPLQDDFGGVDFTFTVNRRVPVAVRCRFDRPWYAPDADVSFRSTEPAKIAARTYAPLAVFAWFNDGRLIAGRLIDIYRMHKLLAPPLAGRHATPNGDGTAFITVLFSELHDARALLRTGDPRYGWGTACVHGETRIAQILKDWQPANGKAPGA